MRVLARKGSRSAAVRKLALDIVARLPERDRVAEAVAVRNWFRKNIRFVRDIDRVETVATPDSTLTTRQGDCDDYATGVASVLLALGNDRVFFKAIAPSGSPRISHVFVVVGINGKLIPLDASDARYPAGTEAPASRSRILQV